MTINIVCLVSFLTAATFLAASTRRILMEDQDSARNQTRRSSVVEPSVVYEYTEYEVKNLSTIATMFKSFAVKKARVVRFHVKLTERCLQKRSITTPNYRFDLVWAVGEEEPYMSLPPEFLRFSDILLPGLRQEMDISMDCSVNERSSVHESNNTTSRLHGDAVTKTLVRNLMQSSGGILCIVPKKSEIKSNSYSCCKFQESTSDVECKLVQFQSEFENWSLNVLWYFFALPLLTLFLPAVVCLFPCREVSENGTSYIVMTAPSSVGLRNFLVNTLDKIGFKLFTFVAILFLISLPQILHYCFGNHSIELPLPISVSLISVPVIVSIISVTSSENCIICQRFSNPVVHNHMSDRVKMHMILQISFLKKHWPEFGLDCLNLLRPVLSFLRRCFPSELSMNGIGRLLLICFVICILPFLMLLALFAFIVSGPLYTLFICSPFFNSLFLTEPVFCMVEECRGRLDRRLSEVDIILGPFMCVICAVCMLTPTYVCASAVFSLLLYTVMVIIAAGVDTSLFPHMALWIFGLYHSYSCYSSYTEKYQLLKIKLYEGIQEKRKTEEGYDSLILYTINKAPAIPEDLYKAACTEFSKSFVSGTFCVVLLKIVGVIIVAASFHSLIIIFGSHTGLNPQIQALSIFVAGSFPKILSMFSSGENTEKLEEIDMQERLINRCIQEHRRV